MVHIIFFKKLDIPWIITKFVSQFVELRNWTHDFLQDCKESGIWIKERREPLSHWQRDPHVSDRTKSTLTGECSPTVSFSGGSKGISVLPESFRVDRGRWFKFWSNGKGSPSAMAARRSYLGLRQPSPTGRASGKGGLSISETARSFLGRKA